MRSRLGDLLEARARMQPDSTVGDPQVPPALVDQRSQIFAGVLVPELDAALSADVERAAGLTPRRVRKAGGATDGAGVRHLGRHGPLIVALPRGVPVTDHDARVVCASALAEVCPW